MKKMTVFACFLLSGCEAFIPQTMGNLKMVESQKALRACILAHPTDAKTQCQSQQALYDLDLQAYRATK